MGVDVGHCRGRWNPDSWCHVILFLKRSPYPVILSLENHCSKEQQEIMAHYLISILGEKLLRAPIDHPTTGELPSPNVRMWPRQRWMMVFVRILVVVHSKTREVSAFHHKGHH